MEKVNLFISYSHLDKDDIKELVRSLDQTFCPQINIWIDEKIALGQEWNEEIKTHLNKADIVLLIISRNFLLSPYIKNNELTGALARHEAKSSTVIPIYMKYCMLDKFPEIKKLQGPTGPDKPLLEDAQKDRLYAKIQESINSIAERILTERKIISPEPRDPGMTQMAKEIGQLRSSKQIFLSLPETETARNLRKNFVISVEGKIKYDTPGWPYQVVPGIPEAKTLYSKELEEQEPTFSAFIGQAMYIILIAGSADELKSPSFTRQYQLAKKVNDQSDINRIIIWFADESVKEGLGKLEESFQKELKMLPSITGDDSKSIFEMIDDFDLAKEKKITELKSAFTTVKKVYMFYDYGKDNENNLRIRLRKKIQEGKDCAIRDLAYESFENEKKYISECEGAVIFYGEHNDTIWYKMRESIILNAKNIKVRAVCVDGEMKFIENKIDRDVSVNEIEPIIKGAMDLETGVKIFKQKLYA